MTTLLLRLAAPLQAWGSSSKFERRTTERLPTKSGIIGMVAAALGRQRNDAIDDLAGLRFGVRVDREGSLLRDYHTARGAADNYVTHRYYLEDAVFLAGLEGEEPLLLAIEEALRRPMYPLFLGRRSCPPEGQILLGLRPRKPLLAALQEEPLLVKPRSKKEASVNLRIAYDADEQEQRIYMLRDHPVSYDCSHRRHGFRRITETIVSLPVQAGSSGPATEHDPYAELEE